MTDRDLPPTGNHLEPPDARRLNGDREKLEERVRKLEERMRAISEMLEENHQH
jgi:hypothetical protein